VLPIFPAYLENSRTLALFRMQIDLPSSLCLILAHFAARRMREHCSMRAELAQNASAEGREIAAELKQHSASVEHGSAFATCHNVGTATITTR